MSENIVGRKTRACLLCAPLLLGSAAQAEAAAGATPATHAVSVSASASASASAPTAGKRQGALFKLSKRGQIGYLFGTIHVGAKSFYPLPPQVSDALAESSRLVLELDTRANDAFQTAVAAHGSYPAGEHIRDHVSADTMVRLTASLHAVGIPVSSVSHMKPWLLANLLMGLDGA